MTAKPFDTGGISDTTPADASRHPTNNPPSTQATRLDFKNGFELTVNYETPSGNSAPQPVYIVRTGLQDPGGSSGRMVTSIHREYRDLGQADSIPLVNIFWHKVLREPTFQFGSGDEGFKWNFEIPEDCCSESYDMHIFEGEKIEFYHWSTAPDVSELQKKTKNGALIPYVELLAGSDGGNPKLTVKSTDINTEEVLDDMVALAVGCEGINQASKNWPQFHEPKEERR